MVALAERSRLNHYSALHSVWLSQNPILVWRKEIELTREVVGAMIGVTAQTLKNWEIGQFTPNQDNWATLSKVIARTTIEQEWKTWKAQRPQL